LANVSAGAVGANTPSWSPDGTKIAFRDGLRLKIANATTGALTLNQLITFNITGRVAWNRTGTTLALPAADGVYTVGSGGGTPVRRLVSANEVKAAAFNYDSTRLSFLATNGSGGFNVYLGSSTGTSGAATWLCSKAVSPIYAGQATFADLLWR
jgi:Tol biopolymer transport system component